MAKHLYAFEMKARVLVPGTTFQGMIRGRVEYLNSEPGYLVRFIGANGSEMTLWMDESEVLAANPPIQEGTAIIPRALPAAKKKQKRKAKR